MNPVIRAIISGLNGRSFIVCHVYSGQSGYLIDSVTRPILDVDDAADTVKAIAGYHRFSAYDLETDDEYLFGVFVSEVGVNVSLKTSVEMAALYNTLTPGSPGFDVLCELWPPVSEPEVRRKSGLLRKLFLKLIHFVRRGAVRC